MRVPDELSRESGSRRGGADSCGGVGIYLLFLRGPTTDIGKLTAWSNSACDSSGGMFTHVTRSPGGREGLGPHTVENEFGTGFKRILDREGTRVDFLDCEVGGSALLYMQFQSNQAALEALKANGGKASTRSLCQLDDALFFTGNRINFREYCDRLGGRITLGPPVRVPRVTGMSLSAAQHTLDNARLGSAYEYRRGHNPPGSRIVRRQDPPPGTRLPRTKLVKLYVQPN
jgi:PASTA domain-containing protein